MTPASRPVTDREIVLTRTVDAPRELVFEAYTRPEQIDRWWGPNGFSTTTHAMDVRPGGTWTFTMVHPAYGTFPNAVRYREVVRPERLVFDHGSALDDPHAFHVTLTFEEQGGKTVITQRSVFDTVEQYQETLKFGAVELGYQTLDKLASYLLTGWLRAGRPPAE